MIHSYSPPQHQGEDDSSRWMSKGLGMDFFARGVVTMSSLVLGPALLSLATQQAVLNQVDDPTETLTIYGFRPSSLLSNIAVLSGVLSTLFLPLFGAIVDYTPYRKQVGTYTAICLILLKALEFFLVGPSNTWLLVALLQIVAGILYSLHITVSYAYICELSNDLQELTHYNSNFYSIIFAANLIFLVLVVVVVTVRNVADDDVATARVSQVLCTLLASAFFLPAWCLPSMIPSRPANHPLPPHFQNSSTPVYDLLSLGFQKIRTTALSIHQQYPDLKSLLLCITFGEAATTALVTISTTYMTLILQMNTTEISIVFVVVLLAGIPGAKLGGWVATKLASPSSNSVVYSIMLCDSLLMISTTLASCWLTSPERKRFAWIFGVLWGICLGWQAPMHTTAFITLIPKQYEGSEAEFMGTYILAGSIFSWMPPLLFTFLNEMGVPMAIGLWSLVVFVAISVYFLTKVNLPRALRQSLDNQNDDNENNSISFERLSPSHQPP